MLTAAENRSNVPVHPGDPAGALCMGQPRRGLQGCSQCERSTVLHEQTRVFLQMHMRCTRMYVHSEDAKLKTQDHLQMTQTHLAHICIFQMWQKSQMSRVLAIF